MNDLTDTNPGTATKKAKAIKKNEANIQEAFVIYFTDKDY